MAKYYFTPTSCSLSRVFHVLSTRMFQSVCLPKIGTFKFPSTVTRLPGFTSRPLLKVEVKGKMGDRDEASLPGYGCKSFDMYVIVWSSVLQENFQLIKWMRWKQVPSFIIKKKRKTRFFIWKKTGFIILASPTVLLRLRFRSHGLRKIKKIEKKCHFFLNKNS